MKRLISGLLCSMLVLGLISNNGVSNSHAEENMVTSDSSNLSESLESDNKSEQSSEPSVSIENDENLVSDEESSEMINQASDKNNENNDTLDENSSDSSEQPSVSSKKKLAKSNLAVAQTANGDEFPISDCEYIIETDGSITLTQYNGTKTDLVIPSKILYDNKLISVNVKINQGTTGSAKKLFPENVHSITFVSIGGTKVGLKSDTNYSLSHLFSIIGTTYNNLVSIDFSGLNMDPVTSMEALFYGDFVPNLQNISFGDNKLPNVTNMSNTFNQLSKLETIQQKWTFGSLTTMNQMFGMKTNQTNLTTIGDTNNWNVSSVTNMNQVFLNCSKLENLDLTNWNVSNVTTMNQMFFNCKGLTSIGDTKNWDVSHVNDFRSMFYNCISLKEIRMDNWIVNSSANLGSDNDSNTMFYLYDISDPLPVLIVASDEKLLNLDYELAGYKPSCEIRINANTGKIAKNEYNLFGSYSNTGLSYFFYNVAISTEEYNSLKNSDNNTLQSKINEWLENNVPTKIGYSLTDWAPTDPSFNELINEITDFNKFISSKAEFKAEWVIDKFNTSVDNTKLSPSGSFGLAYYPTAFNINSTDLLSSGQQEILITKTTSFNIGVKDRTRIKNEWHVTAQLIWTGASIPEAYIQTTNNGTIMKNVSTGSGNYDPTIDLQSLQGNDITGSKDYRITTTPNTIMNSTDGGSAVNNGVYDYDLGEVKLVIPDVSQVRAGTYSGRVEWNLVNGPA
ncbi:BspA family leucine-rich repeat surface protein [Enterococcus casseliflavus]|uniref:BspA family leucine-rich repeat surface protein n=1 Tax=Enterococcus casseliflavus TaxID=37734 RepID=UPI002DB75155|nr:BspA family leucine-rich repeat surface protein [Enterococcus casseliflavus]MEB8418514.1 BspA family leucine-rich repeat surface protein [Enterococcus casseliflavus]